MISNFTGSSVWWQAAPQLPLYEFSVSLGTHILFCCVALSIKFKEGTRNGFFLAYRPVSLLTNVLVQ